MSSLQQIQEFLAQPRIAVIGVSRDPKDYSRVVLRALEEHGCDCIAVNPSAPDCVKNIQSIDPPATAALVLTPPVLTDTILAECREVGIRHIWLRRSHPDPTVISGECPLMFLTNMAWPHRFHGWCRKVTGSYPA